MPDPTQQNPYQSQSAQEHRQQAAQAVRCAVLTVSDTRTLASDRSGQAIVQLLQEAGHSVAGRTIVPDEPTILRQEILKFVEAKDADVLLLTGGTGIAARDQTIDTVSPLFTKDLPGYGELLRMLSYQQIGPAAMLSRATGGLIGSQVVLTMPGSTAAVHLAMKKLILPELPHLVAIAKS